jgi:hypothetical protein
MTDMQNDDETSTPDSGGSAAVPGSAELCDLRRRVKAQRRELRRLNREVSGPRAAFWRGFSRGIEANTTTTLRGKMNEAFGHVAVWEAEHGKPHHSRSQPNDQDHAPRGSGASTAEKTTKLP